VHVKHQHPDIPLWSEVDMDNCLTFNTVGRQTMRFADSQGSRD
jgi:hypothetical protein